jgi:type VI secretion system secreted protein VgrG
VIPGDTVVCADDALWYPPMGGDDPAALAASTAAALAPSPEMLSAELGAGAGSASGVSSAASAVAGAATSVTGPALAGLSSATGEPPELRFRGLEGSGVGALGTLTRFVLRNTVRPSGAAFRDYDPGRPMVRPESEAVSTLPFPPSPLELAAQARAALGSAGEGAVSPLAASPGQTGQAGLAGQRVPLEIYEHHGPFLSPSWAGSRDEAARILRQKRRRASVAEGAGDHPLASPGHTFALRAHPVSELDRAYVITRVRHRGQTAGGSASEQAWKVYEHELECAPSEVTVVPPRPKRKSVQVALTATVTGPPGQEIHVDALGQIKVQFHWDRDGRFDDQSSCWIRTLQPWSGAAWGHQFIPRVGMEVVVVFEGGDPDKPMVLGSLANGTHPPPFTLPLAKTKSGIRTQSSPGGDGYNELSFEDQAGGELVHLHAQRDYEEVIRNEQRSHVLAGRTVRVDGPAREHVGQGSTLEVQGGRATSVGGDDLLRVGGRVEAEVKGDHLTSVEGSLATTVTQTCSLVAHGFHSTTVGVPHAPARSDHYVYGGASIGATDELVLTADKAVTLRCGSSEISLGPDKIVVRSPTIELSPGETLECAKRDGPSLTLGDGVEILSKKLQIFTEKGALELDKELKAKGEKIKLGYDPSQPSKEGRDEEAKTKPFKCQLSDYLLQPYANRTYHLLVLGLRIEGQTDGDGVVSADLPEAATRIVLRLWIDQYPEGRQRVYRLNLTELPPAKEVLGAKHRLKNLGYYRGLMDAEVSVELRAALAEFQQDHHDSHDLEPTGELDQGTAGALEDVHGS